MKLSRWQTTLKEKVTFVGKGLHSGRIVLLDVYPADVNTGIQFLRTDCGHPVRVKASASQISSTRLNTTIGENEYSVSTIEHLMAAFAGMGITNALVRLNAPEVPILDGSAVPFIKKFQAVGVKQQSSRRRVLKVIRPFAVQAGEQLIRVLPAPHLEISCTIDFPHPVIGRQSVLFRPNQSDFLEIAQARTFCSLSDVNKMRAQGLALGGSLENAIVLAEKTVLNSEGLRSPLEFVQHKLLDLIGDLYLLGAPIVGRIEAVKPGHALHAAFMKAATEAGDVFIDQLSPEDNLHRESTNANVDQPVMSFG